MNDETLLEKYYISDLCKGQKSDFYKRSEEWKIYYSETIGFKIFKLKNRVLSWLNKNK